MGKKKLLFAQDEMRSSKRRFEQERKQLMINHLGVDEAGLKEFTAQKKNDSKERAGENRILRHQSQSSQIELFPEDKARELWAESIKEISSSKVSTYRGCPLAFYYLYIMHAPAPSSPSKVFGKEIHFMIESFHKKNFKSVESFINFWKHRWWGVVRGEYGDGKIVFKDEAQTGQFYGLGINILKPFYEHNIKLPKPMMAEEDFSKYGLTFEGAKLVGKWDRLDRIDGKVLITDYKTDHFSPAENTFLLHRHPQFTFYALAWYLKFGEIPDLALHHLRSGKVFRTKRTQEDFEYLRDVIIKTKERITSGDFTPFYGFHCRNCDFMDNPCRMHCVGLGSKLKKLEEKLQVEPEIDKMFSYDVPKSRLKPLGLEEYERKGEFEKAYRLLSEYVKEAHYPFDSKESILSYLLWEEESPIRIPEPLINEG